MWTTSSSPSSRGCVLLPGRSFSSYEVGGAVGGQRRQGGGAVLVAHGRAAHRRGAAGRRLNAHPAVKVDGHVHGGNSRFLIGNARDAYRGAERGGLDKERIGQFRLDAGQHVIA